MPRRSTRHWPPDTVARAGLGAKAGSQGDFMPYLDSGGLRVYYTETGSGLPVLWHTGGCGDGTMWQRAGYIEGLPGYRHILFDHRGHGRSEARRGWQAITCGATSLPVAAADLGAEGL